MLALGHFKADILENRISFEFLCEMTCLYHKSHIDSPLKREKPSGFDACGHTKRRNDWSHNGAVMDEWCTALFTDLYSTSATSSENEKGTLATKKDRSLRLFKPQIAKSVQCSSWLMTSRILHGYKLDTSKCLNRVFLEFTVQQT